MSDESKKLRHTPASYPAASLSLCLKKAALAMEQEPGLKERGWKTQEDFAKACGYKGFDGNSAPKGLIAALTHFGLIERDAQKRIRYTTDLVTGLQEEAARSELIAKAIKRPKIHQALFASFGSKSNPSRQDVSKHLIDRCGFASRPAQIMASNFLEDVALMRSVEPSKETVSGEFVERISAPSGARLTISSTQKLTSQDIVFLEKYWKLKGETTPGTKEG